MEKQQQQHNPHFPWKDRNSETWCQKQWAESCGMKLGFRWGRRRPGSSSWRCEEVVRDGIVEGERKTKNPKSERAMRMGFVDPWNAGEIWGERENGVGGGLERERKDGSRERKWVSWVKWGEEALLLLDGVGAAPALLSSGLQLLSRPLSISARGSHGPSMAFFLPRGCEWLRDWEKCLFMLFKEWYECSCKRKMIYLSTKWL